jgi:hypothetical protein
MDAKSEAKMLPKATRGGETFRCINIYRFLTAIFKEKFLKGDIRVRGMRFLFIMEYEADVHVLCKVTIKESIVILQYSAKFHKFLSF